MKKIAWVIVFLFYDFVTLGQHIPVHLLHQMEFGDQIAIPAPMAPVKSSTSYQLQKVVFGWHPYWNNGLEVNYQWDLISDLCYFSYEFVDSTGQPKNTHNWSTASVVTTALNMGKRVSLCVTLFSNHGKFLTSPTARLNLINNVISALQSRGAHGINIDFEGVSSSYKTQLTSFIKQIADSLHHRIPNSILSIALPSVDWSNVWDVAAMVNYVDYFIIMGYDYYYSGSSTAGPTDPLYTFGSFDYNYSKSITSYLNKGVPANKLLMGVPYYGYEWQTTSLTAPSSTIGSGSTKLYKTVRANSSGNYSTANQRWDVNSMSNYWAYSSGGYYYQCWVDNVKSMGKRFDFINMRGIGGIGIWALGYDDGYTDLWDLISQKFTTCLTIPCSDTLYDLGGPGHNYYDNETFVFTLHPTNAYNLSITFQQFELESGYDSLWLYDGPSTASPLIGGYSGTNSPGTVTTTQPFLTLKFRSDGATNKLGWMAIYQCSVDNIPPTTSIVALQPWITDTITVHFIDQDNSEVKYRFWNVAQFSNGSYASNYRQGHLYETFDNNIPSYATSYTGTWQWSQQTLLQQDSTVSNTNLSFPLSQDGLHTYLYTLRLKFGSADSTSNRRAGFHYFCSNASQINRGNSYMAWFRCDDQKVQLYKYVNNTMYLMKDVTYPFVPNQWYDIKVLYNTTSGSNAVWVNNEFITFWIDTTPYQSGNAFSLRTGNSKVWFDDIQVFVSRGDSTILTIGADTTNLIYEQNPTPTIPAGKLTSIVIDKNNLISSKQEQNINVDYTPPQPVAFINDFGFSGNDKDTIYTSTALTYNATWASSADSNSGVTSYALILYKNACNDSIIAGPILRQDTFSFISDVDTGATYFVKVRVQNGAGLWSEATCSDGVTLLSPLIPTSLNIFSSDIQLYPNPCHEKLNLLTPQGISIDIINAYGQHILHTTPKATLTEIYTSDFSPGLYLIKLSTGQVSYFIKE